jgi:amino acid transporter
LRRGGPLGEPFYVFYAPVLNKKFNPGLLLGYAFVGFVCYLVMVALGEMAAYIPHKRGFAGYATRFVDPALGFAVGWNYLAKYVSHLQCWSSSPILIILPQLIVTPNNINAAGIVVEYWTHKVHRAVWMGERRLTTIMSFY